MKILILEDDENKCYNLEKFIQANFASANTTVAKSISGGLAKIIDEYFDLILLDMTMPVFDIGVAEDGIDEDGGRAEHLGGKEILSQMDRAEINTPVIVVTQFDRFGTGRDSLTLKELDIHLTNNYPRIYRGYVYYNTTVEKWKESLKTLIKMNIK